MGIIRNNTAHLIIVDDRKIVPGRATTDFDVAKAKKLYPEFARMVAEGEITVITEAQAKAIEKAFEEQSVQDLKDYAREHNINVDGLKKAEIIAVIKAEQNKQYEGK